MKTFTTNTFILKNKHHYIDFDFQIQDTWALLEQEQNIVLRMPASFGKTTLLQNLHTHILRNTRDDAFFMDFSRFTRNAMSTFPKFLEELTPLLYDNARQISTAMAKLVASTSLYTKDDLITLLGKMVDTADNRIFLLIDNADKEIKHDPFSEFLGLLLKKQKDMKSTMGASFHGILVSGEKSIQNFKPFERGLDDADYFLTWQENKEYTKTIEINEQSLQTYLSEYTQSIGFEFEPEIVPELLLKSERKILNINKILKFIDEKMIPYKKQKLITVAEIQHAAGYTLANIGGRR